MTDFNHAAWHSAKAQLSLCPLPDGARFVIDRLIAGEVIEWETAESSDRFALDLLHEAGLASVDGDEYRRTRLLCGGHERGLIEGLFP